jgi:hypothetical protein
MARLRARRLCGFKFRRQEVLGSYVVDFACLEPKLVIEVDGGQHAEQAPKDAARIGYLAPGPKPGLPRPGKSACGGPPWLRKGRGDQIPGASRFPRSSDPQNAGSPEGPRAAWSCVSSAPRHTRGSTEVSSRPPLLRGSYPRGLGDILPHA